MPHQQSMKNTHSLKIKELLKYTDNTFSIQKGSFLFQEGMQGEGIFIILSGKIKISKITSDGQELTFRICSKDDIIGECLLFSHSPKYLLNAKVLENADVSFIRKNVIEKELFHDPALAFEFMTWISEQYRRTQTKFRDLLLNGKKGALFSTLIRMSNSYGMENDDGILIDIPLTNQELANFCGTSRESVNRLLSDLKKESIISIKQNKMTIHDLQYLKDEIHCEDCPVTYCSIE